MKNKIWRLLQASTHFIKFVWHNFVKDDCAYRASALAFVTLLAIVPSLIVTITVFSSFPLFQKLQAPLQNFIFANFLPNTGIVVQNYLEQFAHQVSHLSIFGILFLLFTAFLMMVTIERSMNTIWRVHTHRRLVNAFLLYWALFSLTPILLGLSLVASSYLFCFSMLQNKQVPSLLLSAAPYLLSFIGFTSLYTIVPNRSVQLRHTLCGGLVATILFESAKLSFAYYLSHFDFYQLLYGAFATLPLFFIWIYWVWLITLLGAEVSYGLSISALQPKTSIQHGKEHSHAHRRHQINKNSQKKGHQENGTLSEGRHL